MPRVSIIAALYNHEAYVSKAIESVIAQTYTDWELIVWNDGSTDGSLAIANAFASKFPEKIRVFSHDKNSNLGQEKSRNAALEKASGEFVALLDSDDWYHPRKLERLLPAFEDPKVGLVFGRVKYSDQKTGEEKWPPSDVPAAAFSGADVFEELVYDNFIEACGVIFRKKFIDAGLRFDSRFKTCGEYPLWLEIAAVSQLRFIPELVAFWRNHGANTGTKLSLQAKQELVDLKTGLLLDARFTSHIKAIDRAVAKSHYDYASELYRQLNLEKVAEEATSALLNPGADHLVRLKSLALLGATKLGMPVNTALSKVKRRLWELRRP